MPKGVHKRKQSQPNKELKRWYKKYAKAYDEAVAILPDPINPSHYQQGGFQLADVIDAWDLNRWESEVVKYVFRARRKNGLQDYQKAEWYLRRLIQRAAGAGLLSDVHQGDSQKAG